MENTNRLAKQKAVDGQGAFAGNAEPNPDRGTVDAMAAKAGVKLSPGEPADIKRILDERDENRWELDPDSAKNKQLNS